MTIVSKAHTADDLWNWPNDHQRHELVNGELRTMAPAGFNHGSIGVKIASRLLEHVAVQKLGVVVGADTGFILRRNPDTVRAPDAAFVKASRLPPLELPKKFFDGAPDLAVEVLSPSDTVEEVEEKTIDYLETGCSQVWVINPKRKTVTIYSLNVNPIVLREADSLSGGDVVPGFSCRVGELF